MFGSGKHVDGSFFGRCTVWRNVKTFLASGVSQGCARSYGGLSKQYRVTDISDSRDVVRIKLVLTVESVRKSNFKIQFP